MEWHSRSGNCTISFTTHLQVIDVHVEVGNEFLDRQVDAMSGFRMNKPWGLVVWFPDKLVAVHDTEPAERQDVRSRVEDVRGDLQVEAFQLQGYNRRGYNLTIGCRKGN